MSDFNARTASPAEYKAARAEISRPLRTRPAADYGDVRGLSKQDYKAARADMERPYRRSAPAAAPVAAADPQVPTGAIPDSSVLDAPEDTGITDTAPGTPLRGPSPAPAEPTNARKMTATEYAVAKGELLRSRRGSR